MDDTVNTDLVSRLRTADYVLNLLMEIDAAGETVEAQRERCRELRATVNRMIPDGFHDVNEGNIVAFIRAG